MTYTFTNDELDKIHFLKDMAKIHAKNIVGKLGSIRTERDCNFGKVIIAGGCFASWFHHEELNDIDVFFLDDFQTNFVGKAYINNRIADRATIKDHTQYKDSRMNDNIDEVFTEKESETMFDYQYIFTKYKTRQDLISHFDLAHATISYNIGEDKLYLTHEAFDALKNKQMVAHNGNRVQDWRYEKFIARGWTVLIKLSNEDEELKIESSMDKFLKQMLIKKNSHLDELADGLI